MVYDFCMICCISWCIGELIHCHYIVCACGLACNFKRLIWVVKGSLFMAAWNESGCLICDLS